MSLYGNKWRLKMENDYEVGDTVNISFGRGDGEYGIITEVYRNIPNARVVYGVATHMGYMGRYYASELEPVEIK
jgi:hypothetical protein